MLELTAILAAAAVVYGIARATNFPLIPLLLVAGLLMGFFSVMPDEEFVLGILEVGLVFLLFGAGMDMSLQRVGKQRQLAVTVGLAQFGALGLVTGWLLLRTGYTLEEALYIALAVSASSTLVVVRLLKKRQELFEPFGRMILGVLLLQDLLLIAGLVLLASLSAESTAELLLGLEVTAGLVVATIVLTKWVMPRVVESCREEEETLLLIVLSVLFLFLGAAHLGGVPLVVGAFLAGLTLSSFPARTLVMGLLSSLSDFFIVIFFLCLGALVTLPSMEGLLKTVALVALVIIVTPLLVAWVAERAGMTSRGALEAGILLAQTSELSLVVGLLGVEQGILDQEAFGTLVLLTVITMILTPILSSRNVVEWLMSFHPRLGPKQGRTSRAAPVIIIGGGVAGGLLIQKAREDNLEVVVLDQDPGIVSTLQGTACDAVWGDASDEKTLREAGVERARAVVITTGKLHHYEAVRRLTPPETPIWVHAFERRTLKSIAEDDSRIVIYADAAAKSFLKWFSEEVEEKRKEGE